MESVTVRFGEETVEWLDGEADRRGESRAEVIREAVAKGREAAEVRSEAEAEAEELRSELEQAQNRIGELENQLRAVNTRNDDVDELVEYVEHEKTLQERRAEREQEREQAGVFTRAKWWLVGRPAEDTTDG